MRTITAGTTVAAQRRVYFHLVGTDGITPAEGEAGGQPEASLNGAAWGTSSIGTLVAIGEGRYYAELTTAAVATAGTSIETRYKSATTAECPGDSVQVVADVVSGVIGGLGTATVNLVSPLTPDGGQMTILRGDDYNAADRQVYEWTEDAAGWPVLTDADIELRNNEGGPVFTGSVLVDTGTAKKVRVEITRAQSLTAQPGVFRLVAILDGSGREVTLKRGEVITLW